MLNELSRNWLFRFSRLYCQCYNVLQLIEYVSLILHECFVCCKYTILIRKTVLWRWLENITWSHTVLEYYSNLSKPECDKILTESCGSIDYKRFEEDWSGSNNEPLENSIVTKEDIPTSKLRFLIQQFQTQMIIYGLQYNLREWWLKIMNTNNLLVGSKRVYWNAWESLRILKHFKELLSIILNNPSLKTFICGGKQLYHKCFYTLHTNDLTCVSITKWSSSWRR